MHDLERLRRNSEPVAGYIESVGKERPEFKRRLREYRLDRGVAEGLRAHAGKGVAFVFSASWCPDCHRNVPVLGLISEATGIEVRVFGGLMRDSKNSSEIWRIPPSPREVKDFDVRKIPLIVVLSREGEKLGEIVENPPPGKTLEEAVLEILKGG